MATVWVAGASGLVGGTLVRELLHDDSFDQIISVQRRTSARVSPERPELFYAVVDFADARSFDTLRAAEVAFCTIGTTAKKAGSREAFRAVDHDAVLAYARAALAKGVRTFIHVSWLFANTQSWSFYSRVKGEVEVAVEKLGFESVYVFRPSLLEGERAELRPLEQVALAVGHLLGPLLGTYRPTPVDALAKAMVDVAKYPEPGVHVIAGDEIAAVTPLRRTDPRMRHA